MSRRWVPATRLGSADCAVAIAVDAVHPVQQGDTTENAQQLLRRLTGQHGFTADELLGQLVNLIAEPLVALRYAGVMTVRRMLTGRPGLVRLRATRSRDIELTGLGASHEGGHLAMSEDQRRTVGMTRVAQCHLLTGQLSHFHAIAALRAASDALSPHGA